MELKNKNIKKSFVGKNEKNDGKINVDNPKKIIHYDINKTINYCSRCGGEHFDLSCIYYKV